MTVAHLERRVHSPRAALQRHFAWTAAGLAIGLFVAMLIFLEVGRRMGEHQVALYGSTGRHGIGVVDGVVFSLTALLIGFAFSGATSRYEHRRQLIINEVHSSGIAWQRIDTVEGDTRNIRDSFRRYIDALIHWYTDPADNALHEPAEVAGAQRELWSKAVAACLAPAGDKARMLLLPSLNDMFGAVEKEKLARRIHPPRIIYVMLIIAGMASAVFAGYALAGGPNRPWLYMVGVATAIAVAMFVILQLEFPRLGLVGIGEMDQALVEMRATLE